MFGATQKEWDALSSLILPDLRPTVNNPTYTLRNGLSSETLSKRASKFYASGNPGGIYGWQKIIATEDDIAQWRRHPDHGVGIVARTIHGIDIDIDDPKLAEVAHTLINNFTGEKLPARTRPNSGRRLLLFRIEEDFLNKVVIRTEGGAIEFLGTRQFIALAGKHSSGYRYEFKEGIPESLSDIPEIDVNSLVEFLAEEFQTEADISGEPEGVEDRNPEDIDTEDELNVYVRFSEWFRSQLHDGSWAVVCPWHDQHASTEGARLDPNPSSTVFFPKGLGGRDKAGFSCLHTSHGEKNIAQFTQEIGFIEQEFGIEEENEEEPLKLLRRNPKTGLFPGITTNLLRILRHPNFPKQLQLNYFDSQIMVNKERPFEDSDYAKVTSLIEEMGCLSVGKQPLRDAIQSVSQELAYDSAQEWVENLKWDGIDRLHDFPENVLGMRNTPYARAVVRYLFSALAGRLLEPGVKADMVPVLFGRQGCGKSTFVESLSPIKGATGKISFDQSDADMARITRGKSVIEIDELRGLRSRDEDAIKAWVTKTTDEWVPKYMENTITVPRRFVSIGTTNSRRFLGDATGNRRWLPMEVCTVAKQINSKFVLKNLHQIWAQGKSIFEKEGVAWKEAEELAKNEVHKYIRMTLVATRLQRRLKNSPGEYSSFELLEIEFGSNSAGANRTLAEIEVAMQMLGYEDDGEGVWRFPFL